MTGVDSAYIKLAATDDYRLATIDGRWVVVRYYGLQPDTDIGVGRRARPCYRVVRVYLYTRSSIDQFGDDTQALLADGAHADFEEQVLDALDEFVPYKSEGEERKALVLEPLHPMDASAAPPERKPEDDVGIIRSALVFQCRYIPPSRNPQP